MRQLLKKAAAVFVPLAFSCILCTPGQASAVTAQEAIRQQQILQQREEQRRQELLRQHRESLEKPPSEEQIKPLEKAKGAPDERCFEVREIVLQGATLLSDSEKAKLKVPYLGKCLTLTDINNLIRDITNKYIEKGYVTTRAAVPQQDLAGGVLKVLVIEGKVESIEFKGKTSHAERKLMVAFPGIQDEFLNIRDIEQGLDQLNRLPSNNAKVDLVPGSETGTTKVVIDNQTEKTWRATIGMDNSGQESTGELQYILGFEKDNLLDINDLLTVNYNADYESMIAGEHQDSQSLSAFYSFGVGYWTFTGSWSNFDYRTRLQGTSASFSSEGTTTTSNLNVDYVFHRDTDSKSSLGMGFTLRDTSNYLAGVKLDASSHVLSVANISATHTERLLGGVLTMNGQYSRGLPILGAERDRNELNLSDPKSEFDKLTMTVDFYRPFQVENHNFSWSTKLWGQWSPDTLYSAEQASIGSRYTVRGFHEDSLSGDIGGYMRNELALTLPLGEQESITKTLFSNLQLFAGYDAGFIWEDEKDEYEKGSVQGAALGFRTFGGHVLADFTVSKALDAPAHIKNEDLDFYASLKVAF
ncbi:ShlB/FhaC/HecB family hemolysin secretion/activation protein [Salidesulfovibrio onnuriiensis]|uniref:ShlB/FhaC/HecB family hemolysin secretion/activation protein n=1 Tax=Salidesulfovibrio onnuriiensis TaxID=2583823 RepID=UPI0011C74A08|nr:ShlB/FhaC/HecB family hemolysin secretion/activation protein [Salidesulfovibrio onnuriiensis]